MERIPPLLELINEGYNLVSGDCLYHGVRILLILNRHGDHSFAELAGALVGA